MNIPNARQQKAWEEYTVQQQSITTSDLMERAAQEAALFISSHYPDRQRPMVIFSGPGNNGGDGLALARLLCGMGYTCVQAYLFNTKGTVSHDCRLNAERLREECNQVNFIEVAQQFEAPPIGSETLIIDALFGMGINKPLGGGFAALVKFINASDAEVVSLDLPSGLMCEDNTYNSPSAIVRANHTLAIGFPKLAHILADNQPYVGQLHQLDIHLAPGFPEVGEINFHITEKARVQAILKPRSPFGHKGTFGHALFVAGSYGMAGSAVLAAKACLRSGVGKVTLHTPTCNNDILQISVPEAILRHDADQHLFTTPIGTEAFQALGIGPGLGTDKRTALAFIEQISHTAIPLVIDADAINILRNHKGWIQQVPPHSILTPHPAEMKRLGICNPDSFSILVEAMTMARKHAFYIILKGHYTAICTPEGQVYFNPTGNSGMATAGSGDVLTGILTSLLAQGYTPEEACLLGVYLHGLAGDKAAQTLGEHALTASDIISALPRAFAEMLDANGPGGTCF